MIWYRYLVRELESTGFKSYYLLEVLRGLVFALEVTDHRYSTKPAILADPLDCSPQAVPPHHRRSKQVRFVGN
jgi:hypothetical protein